MAFSPSFTSGQVIGLPSTIYLTDNSTGSDYAIVGKRVYLIQYDRTYLVPSGTTTDYIAWATATNPISISILSIDKTLDVRVDWIDTNGVVLYTLTQQFVFDEYNSEFDYSLTEAQAASGNTITADSDYYMNRIKLRVEMDSAIQATALASSITNSQNCQDRATSLRLDKMLFF